MAWWIDLLCLVQIYKEFICDVDLALPKTIKKSMAIVITQKSCTDLFSLWLPMKNYMSKTKKKNTKRKRRNVESTEGNFKVTLTQICKSSNKFVFHMKIIS